MKPRLSVFKNFGRIVHHTASLDKVPIIHATKMVGGKATFYLGGKTYKVSIPGVPDQDVVANMRDGKIYVNGSRGGLIKAIMPGRWKKRAVRRSLRGLFRKKK